MTYACRLDALTPDQRLRHQQLLAEMTASLPIAIAETPHGFELSYGLDGQTLLKLAEWIDYERQCCPFATFTASVLPEAQRIVLVWAGDDPRAKAIIAAAIGR